MNISNESQRLKDDFILEVTLYKSISLMSHMLWEIDAFWMIPKIWLSSNNETSHETVLMTEGWHLFIGSEVIMSKFKVTGSYSKKSTADGFLNDIYI